MLIFAGHIWQSKQGFPFNVEFGKTKYENFLCCLKILAIFLLAPVAEHLALTIFIYYYKFPHTEKQAGKCRHINIKLIGFF